MNTKTSVIFIGTSAGGVSALQKLFSNLPNDFSIPIVVVQHLPADAKIQPELVFGHCGNLKFVEALDKMELKKGHVYFAPPDYHLLIEKNNQLSLSQDEAVHFTRPAIDVLFESAAAAYGAEGCGILLTGANQDGAEGLKNIQECGGYTIVQDPKDAEVSFMPAFAIEKFKPNLIGNIEDIAKHISRS